MKADVQRLPFKTGSFQAVVCLAEVRAQEDPEAEAMRELEKRQSAAESAKAQKAVADNAQLAAPFGSGQGGPLFAGRGGG